MQVPHLLCLAFICVCVDFIFFENNSGSKKARIAKPVSTFAEDEAPNTPDTEDEVPAPPPVPDAEVRTFRNKSNLTGSHQKTKTVYIYINIHIGEYIYIYIYIEI